MRKNNRTVWKKKERAGSQKHTYATTPFRTSSPPELKIPIPLPPFSLQISPPLKRKNFSPLSPPLYFSSKLSSLPPLPHALSFHASFLCSLLLLKSSFPTISFKSSPSLATPLLHCFNRRRGLRVVTSLPHVSCMQLHGSCPPLQNKYLQVLLGWYKMPFGAIDKSNNNKH